MNNQTAKADAGKLEISLVPPQIIRDIAEVRMYGNRKYGDPENWKVVEKKRYVDALLRHTLLYLEEPNGIDSESGIEHYKHMACNMAFICAMEEKERLCTHYVETCYETPNAEMAALWQFVASANQNHVDKYGNHFTSQDEENNYISRLLDRIYWLEDIIRANEAKNGLSV